MVRIYGQGQCYGQNLGLRLVELGLRLGQNISYRRGQMSNIHSAQWSACAAIDNYLVNRGLSRTYTAVEM